MCVHAQILPGAPLTFSPVAFSEQRKAAPKEPAPIFLTCDHMRRAREVLREARASARLRNERACVYRSIPVDL